MKGTGRGRKGIALVLAAVFLFQGMAAQASMIGNGDMYEQQAAVEAQSISDNQVTSESDEVATESRQILPDSQEALDEERVLEDGEETIEGEAVSQNSAGASMGELVEVKSPFEEDRYNPEYYDAVITRYPAAKQGGSLFLTERPTSFENYILNAIRNFEMEVDVSAYNIPIEDMWTEIYHVLNAHPELFYVTVTTAYYNSSTRMIASYIFTYVGTKDTIGTETVKFQEEAKKALAYVSDDMSDYEKALAVHDYIILNCEYDEENFDADTISGESHSAYGALVKKIAVCDGYAKAYQYIMSELLHIPCQVVTSSEMSHAWSLIQIGGKWYHADLTWDDPLYDCIGRVYHEYFLLSDSTIGDSYHAHYSWQVKDENKQDIKAVDDTYKDYKWTDIYSGMFYKNGNWYYVKADKGGIIKDSDLSTASKESLLVHISDEGNPAWISSGCLARIMIWQDENGQDRIYFNTPSVIKSVALDGTEEREEQTVVKAADQFIYGFVIQNNNMKYALRKNTGVNEKQEVRTFGVPGISIASVAAKDYNSLDITLAKVEKAGNASGSGYVIYRRGAWETKWVTAALLEGADNCYFRDSGLGDNLQYVYIARNYQVINGDICYGPYSSEVSAVTMKAPAPQPAPAPTPAPTPAKDTAVKGKVYTYGNYKYKVTTLAKGKTGKVTLTAPVKKTLTKATVPSSVKIKGETYQVTAIAANAFKNNKKLKSVTIGKYVTKIGTNAFYGCKKLKTVTIKTTKLKTVGKKAFQGIVKSATIKVPKSKLAAYKKILQKKTIGLPAKAKIKKS